MNDSPFNIASEPMRFFSLLFFVLTLVLCINCYLMGEFILSAAAAIISTYALSLFFQLFKMDLIRANQKTSENKTESESL
ncbi:hypothetical protein [Poriferisphaera sp. WC338]|uniref:hypothetical protein n=1 Tax=Poriferisphaera sp. WC338 TaxID=3425129 RepID=UPI003D8142A7